jgi:hypothetical protein
MDPPVLYRGFGLAGKQDPDAADMLKCRIKRMQGKVRGSWLLFIGRRSGKPLSDE